MSVCTQKSMDARDLLPCLGEAIPGDPSILHLPNSDNEQILQTGGKL